MTKKDADLKILNEMMSELKKQGPLYKPGNYWEFFEGGILNQIKDNNLKDFRKWPGGTPSNIQSFGGGDDTRYRFYDKPFHPFDKKFEKIEKLRIFSFYNRCINFISKYLPFFSFLSLRSLEAKDYYFEQIRHFQSLLHYYIKVYDTENSKLEDSKSGNPYGNNINGKFYTNSFFHYMLFTTIIKKNINLNEVKFVIELGSGVGFMGNYIKKLNKNIKYICCDIPPVLFIAENYLKDCNYKVAGYEYFKNINKLEDIEFDKFDCFCIPSWKVEMFRSFKADLFINMGSFQEMENEQAMNYLDTFTQKIDNIFLYNSIGEKPIADKKGEFGVIKPINKKFYYEFLNKIGFVETFYLPMESKFSAFFKRRN